MPGSDSDADVAAVRLFIPPHAPSPGSLLRPRRHPQHPIAEFVTDPVADTGPDRRDRAAHAATDDRGADRGAVLPRRHVRRGLRADRALHRVHDGEL